MKSLIAALLFFAAAPSFAQDCPVAFGTDGFLDQVSAAIRATKSCEEGATLAESCALGASGDVMTAGTAEAKCSLDFQKKLSPADRKIYTGLQQKCEAKYSRMQGTMYMAMNAFCHLSVARLYSELYTPAE